MQQEISPYAVNSGKLVEREHEEPESSRRNPFHRDRDRVVHCKAFRRLEYKTQVFVNHLGDNYRTRLTHSIEVAQIARTVARFLGLNEDLTETIALAHDIGHPPFGHAGERALNRLMKDHGGFNHNLQTYRVVTILEERYPTYTGLNLTKGTLVGLQKHSKSPQGMKHTLEAQIVDICDEIAYNNHDVEDGLDSNYLNLKDLDSIAIWKNAFDATLRQFPTTKLSIQIRFTIRNLIKIMVRDLTDYTTQNLQQAGVSNLKDILSYSGKKPLASFSEHMSEEVIQLKKFLFKNLYRHADVMQMNIRGEMVIERIFDYLIKNPELLSEEYRDRIEEYGLHICVTDFIAGMTDRYAMEWNHKILGI